MKQSIFPSHLNISGTRGGATQKSSDLDMGRRPKLESGEFCDAPPFVLEVLRCEDSIFFDFASLYRSMTPRHECKHVCMVAVGTNVAETLPDVPLHVL